VGAAAAKAVVISTAGTGSVTMGGSCCAISESRVMPMDWKKGYREWSLAEDVGKGLLQQATIHRKF
jgi:hypothetical protein